MKFKYQFVFVQAAIKKNITDGVAYESRKVLLTVPEVRDQSAVTVE